jgi:hypothetical protein
LNHRALFLHKIFLFHMKTEIVIWAFNNIYLLLKRRTALFIDGMGIGLRVKLTHGKNPSIKSRKPITKHEERGVLAGLTAIGD